MARQNDHKRVEELISAYLDKRVSPEEQDFFERHVASCADCHAQLETTRAMITALKAMPVVKAPRSFVLPREMAKQPKRSFFSLYPTLKLATAIAAIAFVVLFAGDVLIMRSGGGTPTGSIPAAAPAPAAMQMPEARQAAPAPEATAAVLYQAAPAEAPGTEAATGAAGNTAAGTATPDIAAKAMPSDTATVTESAITMMAVPTTTLEGTAVADTANQAPLLLSATPESGELMTEQQDSSAFELPAAATTAAPTPTLDPLRVIEIALLALAVVLAIATLVVRRKQA